MLRYQKLNNLFGWFSFLIAAVTYILTIEHTASFWDCGEYIACAYKLEVGHPPGAPTFLLIGRAFSLLAKDPSQVAMWINVSTALCSAFTILFLFWTITAFAKKIAEKTGEITEGKMLAIIGSGLVGALAYTFSDSFWFSAVEGEVYGMSSFFTAIVFWAILKWERIADEPHADRWIVFIFFLVGISVGVHLLNLLAIPAICFIYYFKKYETTRKGVIITGILSIILLGGIQMGIIPGIVSIAGNVELFFVNSLGFSFNIGTAIYFILLFGTIVSGVFYTIKSTDGYYKFFLAFTSVFFLLAIISGQSAGDVFLRILAAAASIGTIVMVKNKQAMLNTILLSLTVLLIGYSTFFVLVIRSLANTPMDENNPENAINLLSYLNREQYGYTPLLYGPYYNAPLDPKQPYKDGTPVYGKDEKTKKYIIIDDRKSSIPNYDPEFSTIFPRMYSSQSDHESGYKSWAHVTGEKKTITNNKGEREVLIKPTFSENLKYFFTYQVWHMYLRYLFWDFVGRQNDIQGHGMISKGNWITGIDFLDEMRLGPQKDIPVALSQNKGKNAFYGLPFLLGVLGIWYHFKKHQKDATVVGLLFFFTGFAIVLFLNQPPYQPRERDYAYAASFYAFAIWIGIGALGIFEFLREKISEKTAAIVTTLIGILIGPVLLAKDGFNDHDRSKRTMGRDFAINYLQTCAPNAVIFTNGDNDTFPLWYAQEVEGVRTDVRVINLSLLNTDWYIDQMKRKAYDSDPVPFSLTGEQYRQGTRDYVPFYDRGIKGNISLRELMDFVESNNKENMLETAAGRYINYFPTNKFRVPVDKKKVIENGTVAKKDSARIVENIDWELQKNYVMKNDLMVIDLLATFNWDRPIYFAVTTGPESYIGLEDYFQLEGLAYRFVPIKSTPEELKQGGTRVATDVMYNNVMTKFLWGGMDTPGVYLDENCLRMATNIRIQTGTLASALIEEGKKDSAIAVLDKCIEKTPEENVPYDPSVFSLCVSYFQADAPEKGTKLAKRLFDIYEHNLRYYYSLNRDFSEYYTRDKQQAEDILQRLVYVANSFKQDALAKEFEGRYNTLLNAFPGKSSPMLK